MHYDEITGYYGFGSSDGVPLSMIPGARPLPAAKWNSNSPDNQNNNYYKS